MVWVSCRNPYNKEEFIKNTSLYEVTIIATHLDILAFCPHSAG